MSEKKCPACGATLNSKRKPTDNELVDFSECLSDECPIGPVWTLDVASTKTPPYEVGPVIDAMEALGKSIASDARTMRELLSLVRGGVPPLPPAGGSGEE